MTHIGLNELLSGPRGVEQLDGSVQDFQHELEFVSWEGRVCVAYGVQKLGDEGTIACTWHVHGKGRKVTLIRTPLKLRLRDAKEASRNDYGSIL